MLSKADLWEAIKCVQALIASPDHEQFIATLVRVMHPLMRATVTGYNEADLSRKRFTFVLHPRELVTDAMIQAWIQNAQENPLIQHVQRNPGDFAVHKITDFVSQTRFRKTALCRKLYQPMKGEYQIAMPFPIPGSAAIAIVFNRPFDFTERERELLTLLQPLVYTAYSNVQELTDLRLFQHENQSVVELQQKDRSSISTKLNLSQRESEVLRHLVQGKSNKRIAVDLKMSIRTVEKHVEKLLRKTKLPTRAAVCANLQHLRPHRSGTKSATSRTGC